jgi:hypothetical protein
MTDEFADLPPSPIGSPEWQQERDMKVRSWMLELAVKIAKLDEALAEMLNPDASRDQVQAKKRVEYEMNRLKKLSKVMTVGFDRT